MSSSRKSSLDGIEGIFISRDTWNQIKVESKVYFPLKGRGAAMKVNTHSKVYLDCTGIGACGFFIMAIIG
jgi:hypothetical protein